MGKIIVLVCGLVFGVCGVVEAAKKAIPKKVVKTVNVQQIETIEQTIARIKEKGVNTCEETEAHLGNGPKTIVWMCGSAYYPVLQRYLDKKCPIMRMCSL